MCPSSLYATFSPDIPLSLPFLGLHTVTSHNVYFFKYINVFVCLTEIKSNSNKIHTNTDAVVGALFVRQPLNLDTTLSMVIATVLSIQEQAICDDIKSQRSKCIKRGKKSTCVRARSYYLYSFSPVLIGNSQERWSRVIAAENKAETA